MIKRRLPKWLPMPILIIVIANLLLVMSIRSSYNDAIRLRDEKIKFLNEELEDARVNHIIDRGRLDVICENHAMACENVE